MEQVEEKKDKRSMNIRNFVFTSFDEEIDQEHIQ